MRGGQGPKRTVEPQGGKNCVYYEGILRNSASHFWLTPLFYLYTGTGYSLCNKFILFPATKSNSRKCNITDGNKLKYWQATVAFDGTASLVSQLKLLCWKYLCLKYGQWFSFIEYYHSTKTNNDLIPKKEFKLTTCRSTFARVRGTLKYQLKGREQDTIHHCA
jgi:hypothetical protein